MEDLNYKMHINESDEERANEIQENQKILLRIGSSDLVKLLFTLSVIIYVLNIVSVIPIFQENLIFQLTYDVNLNWLKGIIVLILILSLITPIMYYLIYFGAKENDIVKFHSGINIYRIITLIGLYFLYFSFAISGLAVLIFFFQSPFIAIILGAILGGILYVYYRYIRNLLDFLENLQANIKGTSLTKADPEKLFVFIIIGIVLSVFSALSNLFGGGTSDYSEYGVSLQTYVWADTIVAILGISIMIIFYKLLHQIQDEFTYHRGISNPYDKFNPFDGNYQIKTNEQNNQLRDIDDSYHMKNIDE